MKDSMKKFPGRALCVASLILTQISGRGQPVSDKELAREIFETMIQVPGVKGGHRPVHAKGLVCQGTFVPSSQAKELSRAAHFQGPSVPVTVRFSDGSPEPLIPDNSPNAGPRGMAIRFALPGGGETDLVLMSHNGFVVGTGMEFLALQKAIVATDPSKPHPWPVEEFVTSHPRALKFVQENRIVPASFATEAFFSNDSFVFINQAGTRQAGRYQMVPFESPHNLTDQEAASKPANFLLQDLQTRLASGAVRFRLVVQLPNATDPTSDPSLVWPDDRKTMEMGIVTVSAVDGDSTHTQKSLAFDPTNLTEGLELSDDPLPALRSRVYRLSVQRRQQSETARAESH